MWKAKRSETLLEQSYFRLQMNDTYILEFAGSIDQSPQFFYQSYRTSIVASAFGFFYDCSLQRLDIFW